MWNSLWIALSTYSRIPVPQADWNEKNMSYSMAFLPVIGVVTGAVLTGWILLAQWLQLSSFFTGAIAMALIMIITGGIHLDGLCDTFDALASHQPRERKLEIMKDAHTGAFGIIGCCCYLILLTACLASVAESFSLQKGILLTGIFVSSRAVSGYLTQVIPNARGNGMLMQFTSASDRKIVSGVLTIWMLAAFLGMLLTNWVMGLCTLVAGIVFASYWLRKIQKEFGGITGDIIGCFLQLMELAMLIGMIVGEGLCSFI